jgi:hypothetical protein
MLQVYLYGATEQGFLDLPKNAKLDIEGLAEAFDDDLSTGDFSLPLDVEWTDNNRRLFGFAERLENANNNVSFWKVDCLDDNWPEIVSGQLTILEKIGKFSYKRGKFSVSITATKGLFGSLIYNKKMNSLQLGGTINWPTVESRAFATDVMKGLYPQYPFLAFAPVAIENYFDKNRPDYANEFLVKDTVNNIVITGSGADDWQFARPVNSDPNNANSPLVPSTLSIPEHKDFRTVPFFQLKWLLKKVFEEFGFTLVGDVVDGTDFDDLFLFNNYSLEAYQQYQDFNRNINPANHVPNTANSMYMLISDFLKNAFSFFNAYFVFDGANNLVSVRYRNRNITERNVVPITQYVIDEFDSTIDTNSQNKGYKLAFGWDANDGYHSDRVKELSIKQNNETWIGEKILLATVATFADLATFTITGVTLTTDYCVFVQADNIYYAVADATNPAAIKWDAYAEALQDYEKRNAKNEDPGRTITLGMAPLCNYVELNSTSGLYEKKPFVGTRGTGSYATAKGVRVNTTFGLSVFYIKKQVISGNNIPTSFTHNRDAANNLLEKYSLSLYGTDGLATLHSKWQDVKEKAETVKTSITVDKKMWAQIQQATQVEIDSVIYLVQKNERTIPQLEPMVIYLIPM